MIFKRICLFILFIFLLNCSSNNDRVNRSEITNQDSADINQDGVIDVLDIIMAVNIVLDF